MGPHKLTTGAATRLRDEARRASGAARSLDRQAVVVLLAAAVLLVIQFSLGSRAVFRERLAHLFVQEWRGMLSWGWWFAMQGVTGFVVPVAILRAGFKRRAEEMGLGLGDWRLALWLGGLYLPLAVVGTWILSDQPAFQASYPHYGPAAQDWRFFVVYELLYLFYWIGWEYLWRGFILFGTAPAFGVQAVFVQALPFVTLHLDKPVPEALLSIVGAVFLGALVWRCRSFWIAVPVHALQMLSLDLWCSLRVRTGASGIGPEALFEMITAWGSR